MKIRIMGLAAEAGQAVDALRASRELDVIEVNGPYPNRGDSRMVRIYVEARLTGWCTRSWHDGDCCQGSRKQPNPPNSPPEASQLPGTRGRKAITR